MSDQRQQDAIAAIDRLGQEQRYCQRLAEWSREILSQHRALMTRVELVHQSAEERLDSISRELDDWRDVRDTKRRGDADA